MNISFLGIHIVFKLHRWSLFVRNIKEQIVNCKSKEPYDTVHAKRMLHNSN